MHKGQYHKSRRESESECNWLPEGDELTEDEVEAAKGKFRNVRIYMLSSRSTTSNKNVERSRDVLLKAPEKATSSKNTVQFIIEKNTIYAHNYLRFKDILIDHFGFVGHWPIME